MGGRKGMPGVVKPGTYCICLCVPLVPVNSPWLNAWFTDELSPEKLNTVVGKEVIFCTAALAAGAVSMAAPAVAE